MQDTIIDGVKQLPQLGIKVIVIGAGVGGLMAALECWRKGCEVVVIERAAGVSPMGDFFTIPPSGMSTLKYYPSMHADYHQDVYDCTISIWNPQGHCVYKTKPDWVEHQADSAAPDVKISFIKRRPVFTKMLYDQCIRLGIPVLFSQEAKSLEENGGVVITVADGTQYHGDVCIAADGVGSHLTKSITGVETPVRDSGYAAARIAFPRSQIKKGSLAESLLVNVEEEPEFRVYLGDDLHVILYLTKDHVAFTYTHESDGHAAESWNNLRDASAIVEDLLTKATDWDPAVLDFLRQIPNEVVDWGLRWRDPAERWTSDGGRVIKIGDSAHAFLPTAGNGAVQAMETAITVAECLRVGGLENVVWAFLIANKLRFERVSILQQSGFANREELHHADLDAIAHSEKLSDVGFFKQGGWTWKHRPEVYAEQNYWQCLRHLQEGTPFVNTNLPPGHEYKPWTMDTENERMARREVSDLKRNGYWGV